MKNDDFTPTEMGLYILIKLGEGYTELLSQTHPPIWYIHTRNRIAGRKTFLYKFDSLDYLCDKE